MEINVVYGVNEKYTEFAYLSLLSCLRHFNNDNILICHLISPKINKYVELFRFLENKYKNFKFKVHYIDTGKVSGIHTSLPHLDYSTYFRFFVSNILENDGNILYIDADTFFLNDISDLFKCKIKENDIIGAVQEFPSKSTYNTIHDIKLSINKYFNAGVLYINLGKRKSFNTSEKAISLLEKRKYTNDDQDALNILFNDKFTELNGKYNTTTSFFNDEDFYFDNGKIKRDYVEAYKNPTIVHFTGSVKPWDLFCIHPYTIQYDKFLKWANKLGLYKLSFKKKFIIIFHQLIFIILPKYNVRIKLSKFIHKFL